MSAATARAANGVAVNQDGMGADDILRFSLEIGLPALLCLVFLGAARYYNRATASRELSPEYFRVPSNYVVTVAAVAFPLIGAILALQQSSKITALGRSLLVAGLLLFLLALLVGAWLTYGIISRAGKDKITLSMPKDWLYSGALGVSYVLLICALIECFGYFAFGLNTENPPAVSGGAAWQGVLIVRPRIRIGQSRDELSQALGAPDARAEDGALWNYHTGNSVLSVRFAADGRVKSITEEDQPGHAQ